MSEYSDHRWLTFHQAKSANGSVKRGERGTTVMLWTETEDEKTGKERMVSQAFVVFNVEQCENLELPIPTKGIQACLFGIDKAELILNEYMDAPKIRHGLEQAAYFPIRDLVTMPNKLDFDSEEAYWGTLFHELLHSTMHPTRLNRQLLDADFAFGTASYAQEELLAEIGSAFLCSEAGIDNLIPCTGYVASWLLKTLQNDSSYIVKAASQAQKAVDWILGTHHQGDSATNATRPVGELVAI